MPPALPTNSVPFQTAGAANAVTSPGKPRAHFSFSFRICSGIRPAASAAWYLVLDVDGLQPFQLAAVRWLNTGRSEGHTALPGIVVLSTRVPRKFATASRSSRRIG